MKYTDWRIWGNQSYKNLDEQRQDKERAQARGQNRLITRIVSAVVAVLIVLLKNIPEGFFDSFTGVLPVIGLFLAIALPILIGSLFFSFSRRKFRRENFYAEEVPEFPSRHKSTNQTGKRYSAAQAEKPSRSEERYTANTSSDRDYSGADDSWDIKDAKPPWEL